MKNLLFSILLTLSRVLLIAQCPPDDLLIFSSQAQIDAFKVEYPNCTEFDGGITITGSSIINLYGLSNLAHIGGDLNILYSATLTGLAGLQGLTSVGGTLMINENYILSNLTGLNNLASVGGHLIVYKNNNLSNLGGLNSLSTVGNNLIISENGINSLSGLLSLESIGNVVEISYNPFLINITALESLNTVGGDFWINNNGELLNLDGLENLVAVGGELVLRSNYKLNSIEGLSGLATIGGQLAIQSNYALGSLAGLDNINASSIDELKILNNTILSTCEVLSICEYLGNPGGDVVISNNAAGCSNRQEIENACEWVSVSEIDEPAELLIYPNPACSNIIIGLSGTHAQNIYVSVSNTNGQQVIAKKLKTSEITLDISFLPKGVYFVKVYGDALMVVKKMIRK